MQSFTSIMGTIAVFLLCHLAHAQTSKPVYTFDPGATCTGTNAVAVDLPGGAGKGIQLPPNVPQWGWCSFDLKRTFPAGRYRLDYTLWALGDSPAAVGIYVEQADGKLLECCIAPSIAAGQSAEGTGYFYATGPFSRLAMKKHDASKAPSQVVSKLVLKDMGLHEYLRLEGYWMVCQYPAPWGLRSPIIQDKLSRARTIISKNFDEANKDLPEVETWLDRRSVAADLCGRADDLLRAVRLTKTPGLRSQSDSIVAAAAKLKLITAENRQKDMDQLSGELTKKLDALEAALNKALGGIVRPELGTDIFTWVKDWQFVGSAGAKEYSEPVPWRMVYDDKAVIRLMNVGEKVDLESSWTTSIYRGEKMDIIYSVLSPMTIIKAKTNRLTVGTSNLSFDGNPAVNSKQQVDLVSDTTRYVFLLDTPAAVKWSNNDLTFEFEKPGATIGLFRLPKNTSVDSKILDFYRNLLANPPVQCTQIQRGQNVEQIFEGLSGSATIAPVPHLMQVSLRPTSKLKVRFDRPIRTLAGGFTFIPDTDRFSYILPNRRRTHTCGINVHDYSTTPTLYKELKEYGCKTIRLDCVVGVQWDAEHPEKLKEIMQAHLKRAREAGGLKVGISLYTWTPSGLSGEKGFSDLALLAEFIKRWTMIIEWCKPFNDVVGWYDLMNEPEIYYEKGSVKPYAAFMRKAIKALRPHAGTTPFLVEVVNGANTVGLEYWEDLGDNNIIIGYHDYWPHMFTHQRVVERGDRTMPAVFYPSFMPMIEWEPPSWNNQSPNWQYWDRWKCDQISLPVMRLMIEKDLTMDNGEYGIAGRAGETSIRSGRLWLRDSVERCYRLGINHSVYGVAGGFTWFIPEFRSELQRLWKKYANDK